MTAAEQRPCPRCGRPFTWTTSAPRQKFCQNTCRAAYNRNPARYASGPIPPGSAPPGRGTTPADGITLTGGTMTSGGIVTNAGTMPGHGVTAVRPCPHCGKAITAITWIVPPAAAAVTAPLTSSDTPARSVTRAR
jgi:endogenous inhibitor of DNA gyrase (YacG/DUF329 family)